MSLCQAGDTVHRVTLLIEPAWQCNIPVLPLLINIRKAFDSLTWPYLFYILQKWGFGPQYAVIKSMAFPIFRVTRQGCLYALSPLLFALAIEPYLLFALANYMRSPRYYWTDKSGTPTQIKFIYCWHNNVYYHTVLYSPKSNSRGPAI